MPEIILQTQKNFNRFGPYLLFIIIGQIFHLSSHLMKEKENKTKEGLIIVGANPYLLSFTWALIYFPLSLILTTMVYLVDPSHVMSSINIFLYCLLSIFYIFSMYCIVVVICNIIKKFKIVVVLICLFISLMLTLPEIVYKLQDNGHVLLHRILSAIFPFFGFSMAVEEICNESDQDREINFSNMFDSEFGINFVFVAADAIFYFLLVIFMEYIGKTEFRSFSIRNSLKKNKLTDPNEYANDIQEDPKGSECFVEVKNIYKFYKFRRTFGRSRDDNDKKLGKIFAANNNISFKVYNNEIFGILGHNGAGKSTLIQNMVGIINPDKGETYYGGLPFSKNKKKIYRQFGICLQTNVIIEGFTVADHFKLYSGIKGADDSEESLQKWLNEVDLVEKKDYSVEKMSGGQKRKLCIGLALIGNPKYVFLDEPTTGLDPLSRRKIWNLLLKVKKDRVIFITTHYMDEADIIADRKLILTRGVIRCLGSSIYLKKHFQMKYNLEVETNSPKEVNDLIHGIIPSAQFCSNLIETNDDKKNGIYSSHSSSPSNITEINGPSSTISSTTLSSLVTHTNTNSETRLTIDMPNHEVNFPVIPSQYQYRNDNFSSDALSNTYKNSSYTWKLPITSVNLFSNLLKKMENARGSILSDFSLNEPMLEELFVNLENETEAKRNPENAKSINKDLFKNENVKRPGMWGTALRLCRYRLLVYLRQKNYLIMGIIVPLCLMGFFLPVSKKNFGNVISKALGSCDISAEIYNHQQWNYEIENSDGSISNDTIAQEIKNNDVLYMNHEEIFKTNQAVYNPPYFVSSFSINFTEQGIYNLSIYTNRYIAHSLPSTLNVLSNAILAANHVNETISVRSKPLNTFSLKELNLPKFYATVIFVLCISFPLSFYGTNVVRERVQHLMKQLQLNGVSHKSYWFSVLISDYIIFMITCILISVAFVVFNFKPLLYVNNILFIALFIIIGTFGCLLLQYCFSFYLKSDSSAFLIFFMVNIVPTYCIFMNSYNNQLIADYDSSDISISIYMGVLCSFLTIFFPNFGIARVYRTMIHIGLLNDLQNTRISFWKILIKPSNQIIFCLVGEILSICFYTFIIKKLTREAYNAKKGVFETPEKIEESYMKELKEGDEDIYNEYKRVCNNEEFPIRIIKLAKEYSDMDLWPEEIGSALKRDHPSKYGEFHMSDKGSRRIVMSAFDNVSIGVDRRECFGILGPNGSGKTSLLNTASFSFPQTLGKIYYDGKDITERQDNEITLGYCPQEDTLWEEYTLLEHIEMFLYIRGYSHKQAKRVATEFIDYCRLTEHKNKMPFELSGGTRRKLNLLVALCCSSSKIIMDEPTAGMDPSTRRYVWDIINSNRQFNYSSNIISTHSMEEAELLCDRIAIMVNGKIRCIGSPRHLKMKFGNTYILEVYTNNSEKFHQEVVIGRNLFGDNDYELEVKSHLRIKYEVRGKRNISRVFDIMENCRDNNLFIDYSYSQTSLEQIFLNIVHQYKEKEE